MSYIKNAMMNVIGDDAPDTYIKLAKIDSESANKYLQMIFATMQFKESWRAASLLEDDLQIAIQQGQEHFE